MHYVPCALIGSEMTMINKIRQAEFLMKHAAKLLSKIFFDMDTKSTNTLVQLASERIIVDVQTFRAQVARINYY